MNHSHSLKHGMTIISPTVSQCETIHKLAKIVEIRVFGKAITDKFCSNLCFRDDSGIVACVDSEFIDKEPQLGHIKQFSVAFEQFVAAMVTPPSPAIVEEKKEEARPLKSIEELVIMVQEGKMSMKELLDSLEYKTAPIRITSGISLSSEVVRVIEEARTRGLIKSLKAENEALRIRLEEKRKYQEADNRVDFGVSVTFTNSSSEAWIGKAFAKRHDVGKVLIAGNGYEWQLLQDYYQGRNAVQLVKTGK